MAREEVVSNASEQLILVDELDREIGFKSKNDCHRRQGRAAPRVLDLRASIAANELLLQQRSPTKMLWPNYWSNTCCSHPRRGEVDAGRGRAAAQARARLRVPARRFCTSSSIKHSSAPSAPRTNICSVYYGRYDGPVDVNVNEIAAWRWVDVATLERELAATPERFTPWFKMEWVHIKANYLDGMLASTGTDG